MTTNRNGQTLLASQPTQPEITINQNYLIQGVLDSGVKSRTSGGPPSSATDGDAFIVDVAVDEWALASVNDIAIYSGGGYLFITPTGSLFINTPISVDNESTTTLQQIYWDGGAWLSIASVGGVKTPVLVVGDSHELTQTNHSDMIVFDTANDGQVNMPAGLLPGTQITVCNIGGGSVVFVAAGSESVRGGVLMADPSGVIGIMKINANIWQSTERLS